MVVKLASANGFEVRVESDESHWTSDGGMVGPGVSVPQLESVTWNPGGIILWKFISSERSVWQDSQ